MQIMNILQFTILWLLGKCSASFFSQLTLMWSYWCWASICLVAVFPQKHVWIHNFSVNFINIKHLWHTFKKINTMRNILYCHFHIANRFFLNAFLWIWLELCISRQPTLAAIPEWLSFQHECYLIFSCKLVSAKKKKRETMRIYV